MAAVLLSLRPGLGQYRFNRSLSWLYYFRCLRISFEHLAIIHEAFLNIACAIICY